MCIVNYAASRILIITRSLEGTCEEQQLGKKMVDGTEGALVKVC